MAPEEDVAEPGAHEGLLHASGQGGPARDHESTGRSSRHLAWSLYVSHALTTWNARSYEFAAILFTAAAFPDTLLWSSVRGMVTTLAALAFSSWVGHAIGRSSNRLRPLWISICANRASVIAACVVWFFLLIPDIGSAQNTTAPSRVVLFLTALVLGIFEKLSGIANMLCSEREWVPLLAAQAHDLSLTRLNAGMRRIDLICKLVSPLIISAMASVFSLRAAVGLIAIFNATTWAIELWTAKRVWRSFPQDQHRTANVISTASDPNGFLQQIEHLLAYFRSDVCVPSLALALLHFSALSYSATLITFLLSVGFPLVTVTVARTIGGMVEVSSSFVAPAGVHRLAVAGTSLALDRSDSGYDLGEESVAEGHGTGLARCGLWGLSLQLVSLIPVVSSIWGINLNVTRSGIGPLLQPDLDAVTAVTLFAFLSISRLGLWIFDLTTQELTQTRIAPSRRVAFGGTEAAFVALFELLQWISGAVFSDPSQFHYLATGSLGAVLISTMAYATWVWHQRGHLLHLDKIPKTCGCAKDGG